MCIRDRAWRTLVIESIADYMALMVEAEGCNYEGVAMGFDKGTYAVIFMELE